MVIVIIIWVGKIVIVGEIVMLVRVWVGVIVWVGERVCVIVWVGIRVGSNNEGRIVNER
jgi:hypothetical protein